MLPLQPALRTSSTFIADILIDDFVAPRTARGASGTTSRSAPRRLGGLKAETLKVEGLWP